MPGNAPPHPQRPDVPNGPLSNSACGLRYSPVDLGNSVLEVLYSNGDIAAWVVSVYVQLADDFSQIQTDGLQRRDIFQADKHCLVPECGRVRMATGSGRNEPVALLRHWTGKSGPPEQNAFMQKRRS